MDGWDWSDVRVFLAVAETGSLAEAARALRLSQATAGRRLKALEAGIGGQLFERLPNRLVLTALGLALLEPARSMQVGAASLDRQARARALDQRQVVRITATTSVAAFVTDHLAEILDACPPGTELGVIATRARLSLANREAELALRMERLPSEGDLAARRIGRFAFALYAARAYCALTGWTGDAGGLVRMEFVGLPPSPKPESQAAWLDAVAGGRIRARVSEAHLRHAAARSGLGATLLPCVLADADPGLVRLAPPPPELVEDVWLMVHRDLRTLPAVRAAAAALQALFRRKAARLDGSAGASGGADPAEAEEQQERAGT
ncbi:LysR family transcriptional regulator [Arenibaculum pallidiluteum]|uniref:LysR family transcriptional regulator n=1 Tax=Arenibaculum pallidiluteum TaxID=2812559 RepID=UPI001A96D8DC|nr:LysR family transcriptional regulator [Arenibaculum pallidiluteum]